MVIFSRLLLVSSLSAPLLLSGCTSMPSGPSVLVLPGSHSPFDQFRNDDMVCRQFSSFQVGDSTPNSAAASSGVTSAVVGTVVGAAAGAAIGGGSGAAIGAGGGLAAGSIMGAGAASGSMVELQQRYDAAYIQCMYAKGHQVPVPGNFLNPANNSPAGNSDTSAPPPQTIPPPPPGTPPPPPVK